MQHRFSHPAGFDPMPAVCRRQRAGRYVVQAGCARLVVPRLITLKVDHFKISLCHPFFIGGIKLR